MYIKVEKLYQQSKRFETKNRIIYLLIFKSKSIKRMTKIRILITILDYEEKFK